MIPEGLLWQCTCFTQAMVTSYFGSGSYHLFPILASPNYLPSAGCVLPGRLAHVADLFGCICIHHNVHISLPVELVLSAIDNYSRRHAHAFHNHEGGIEVVDLMGKDSS